MNRWLTDWSPRMLSVLRIVTGLIFLEHGTQKFLSFPAGQMAGSGLALDTPASFAGIVEFAARKQPRSHLDEFPTFLGLTQCALDALIDQGKQATCKIALKAILGLEALIDGQHSDRLR